MRLVSSWLQKKIETIWQTKYYHLLIQFFVSSNSNFPLLYRDFLFSKRLTLFQYKTKQYYCKFIFYIFC